ncbi:MAG: primosomal protein N' [Planctomycetes bacterium]|nr:primosomal protein N' [Planctomycetota bacterium]
MRRTFHYAIPERLRGVLQAGSRVLVPLGRRQVTAWCVGLVDRPAVEDPKEVLAVVDPSPVVDTAMLRFTRWLADYYGASWGEALEAALPAAVRHGAGKAVEHRVSARVPPEELRERSRACLGRAPARSRVLGTLAEAAEGEVPLARLLERARAGPASVQALVRQGVLRVERCPVRRDPLEGLEVGATPPPTPTEAQEAALKAILPAVEAGRYEASLLWGVTGSGKTEVYLRVIEAARLQGRGAIVLVPEIALTPQTVRRFVARFGSQVAVLHSHLTGAQRAHQWARLASGEASIAVGPRSALFAPVGRLGVVVVDEEQEGAFKQEQRPRYHGRDAAVMRAHQAGCPVILGSATPSLESWNNALTGRYRLLRLPGRAAGSLPRVEVVDMAEEFAEAGGFRLVSERLLEALGRALAAGGQAIVLRNRRGHATHVHCPRCGHVVRCGACDVAMTWHRRRGTALCHYCGAAREVGTRCPECLAGELLYWGSGTERVEEFLAGRLPGVPMGRLDSDTMLSREAYEKVLGAFERGEVRVLVGTQMVAKGLDFPGVTLVGVIGADATLNLPDFRAAERCFQLLSQVAGRAGRGPTPGRVLVQSFQRGHYALEAAVAHDYEGFARRELTYRRSLGYPPFGRLLAVLVHGRDPARTGGFAREVARALGSALGPTVPVLGPVPAPIPRLAGRHRWQCLVKGRGLADVRAALAALDAVSPPGRDVQLVADVDPA